MPNLAIVAISHFGITQMCINVVISDFPNNKFTFISSEIESFSKNFIPFSCHSGYQGRIIFMVLHKNAQLCPLAK